MDRFSTCSERTRRGKIMQGVDSKDGDIKNTKEEVIDEDIRIFLVEWAIKHNISHKALSSLLPILAKHGIKVPLDVDSLFKTPLKKRSGTYGSAQKSFEKSLSTSESEEETRKQRKHCHRNRQRPSTSEESGDDIPLSKASKRKCSTVLKQPTNSPLASNGSNSSGLVYKEALPRNSHKCECDTGKMLQELMKGVEEIKGEQNKMTSILSSLLKKEDVPPTKNSFANSLRERS